MVETLAQNWRPLDREVQQEFADRHQRTSALLGWACGQNGLLEICAKVLICRGLQWWRWRQLFEEKEKWAEPLPKTFQNLQVGGYCVSRGIQRLSTGWLRFVHDLG